MKSNVFYPRVRVRVRVRVRYKYKYFANTIQYKCKHRTIRSEDCRTTDYANRRKHSSSWTLDSVACESLCVYVTVCYVKSVPKLRFRYRHFQYRNRNMVCWSWVLSRLLAILLVF